MSSLSYFVKIKAMKRKISIQFVLTAIIVLLFFIVSQSLADETVVVDSISFKINKVSYGQWSKPRHHMINDMVEHKNLGSEELSYIAISYTMTNMNKTKKVDLDGNFNYSLFDNFGNRYRPMRKPDNFKTSVLIVSKNFPSLYPNEVYGETLFFEAPIPTANNLMLSIASENMKLSRPVELSFTPEEATNQPIVNIEDILKQSDQEIRTTNNALIIPLGAPEIAILSPQSGVVWDQGETARLEVTSKGDQKPKKIILIALDTTYLDSEPQKKNIYDLNIPFDTKPGSYTANVIAEWPSGDISSTFLSFYVKDSTPLDIL